MCLAIKFEKKHTHTYTHTRTRTQQRPLVHWSPLLHMPRWTAHDGSARPRWIRVERNSLELACGFYSDGINLDEVGAKKWTAKQEKLKAGIVAVFET